MTTTEIVEGDRTRGYRVVDLETTSVLLGDIVGQLDNAVLAFERMEKEARQFGVLSRGMTPEALSREGLALLWALEQVQRTDHKTSVWAEGVEADRITTEKKGAVR